jgi:hypothetical protein
MKGKEGAMAAVERLYTENGEGLRKLAMIESEERDWRHYVTLIGLRSRIPFRTRRRSRHSMR